MSAIRPGWWGLPGGGVDHGESPHAAVRRELYEETGLTATSATLVDVHDVHLVEVGRGDMYEDYHGVHLLYAVEIEPGTEPHVVEVGGTTDEVRWVDLATWGQPCSRCCRSSPTRSRISVHFFAGAG